MSLSEFQIFAVVCCAFNAYMLITTVHLHWIHKRIAKLEAEKMRRRSERRRKFANVKEV